jgi:hypothetical protein
MLEFAIAVKSCEADARRGCHKAIRETWGNFSPTKSGLAAVGGGQLELFFFVGRCERGKSGLLDDEFAVNCSDDYEHLPHKTKRILHRLLADARHRFDYIFLCDTDTYVNVPALLASGFDKVDLMGLLGEPRDGFYAWPSGGAGYWLSRRAAEVVANAQMDAEWAEDRMVGQILGPLIKSGDLTAADNQEYSGTRIGNEWHGRVTSHFCARGMHRQYDPEWMRRMHRESAKV